MEGGTSGLASYRQGVSPKFPELEKELLAWNDDSGHVGKVLRISRKALQLAK